MSRSIVLLTMAFSTALWADQSGNTTLATNSFLNLDTGVVSGADGDILWTGAALLPQGHAATHNLGKYGSRAFKVIRARDAFGASYGPAPIPPQRWWWATSLASALTRQLRQGHCHRRGRHIPLASVHNFHRQQPGHRGRQYRTRHHPIAK